MSESTAPEQSVTERFRAARDQLVRLRTDLDAAHAEFEWPRFEHFNFALDWFDALGAGEEAEREALVIVEEDGTETRRTYAQLSRRSSQLATWLREQGVRRGDRVILMLGNQVELWETMLACTKLGAPMIPTTVMLGPADLRDRVERGHAAWVVTSRSNAQKFEEVPGDFTIIAVPDQPDFRVRPASGAFAPSSSSSDDDAASRPAGAGSGPASEAASASASTAEGAAGGEAGAAASSSPESAELEPVGEHRVLDYTRSFEGPETFEVLEPSPAEDPLLLYFTSGTTSLPKLVEHTNVTYPVGHLSTMYWIGLEPGDVHLNVASPGWGKHAWSNFYAPFIAGATVFLYNYTRFDAAALMDQMEREGVTSFCAPPTVWRMLIQSDLTHLKHPPRKTVSAGEPLNPGIIARVREAWGTDIRDGYGQTESSLQIANTPGMPVKPGAMGRALPGYETVLIDPNTDEESQTEGELCLRLDPRPVSLTPGYHGDPEKTAEAFRDGLYHTGDVVSRDENGVFTYVGRADDVFKASDYRLSPFELESVVIEHPAVVEVAVVPSPDPIRLAVPKAYVVLANGYEPTAETAESILHHCRVNLAAYKRIRRLEFAELPKTISGKIRRVELRHREMQLHPDEIDPQGGSGPVPVEGAQEFADTDFPSLRHQ
ncbi:AMP-binding protein [Glutamicibacter protophormiae]|uniref:AMP-binding protein n=1 Tax=Kocuria TaxID=57493 RepID=UPI0006D779A7|nr:MULTISPECIES: AMP-binding protein [Kocuria]MDN5630983.1 AMP-binding protein [Kocuria sp.]RUP84996.1 AMP-dependent synthetase [Kocuria sp. HSID17590]RUQ13153.1 AMP-dependent synthetase [Kocuria sp. HSID17582]WNB88673.1 AMP-binding protein [Glutamicibacter protophormiae]